MTAKRRVTKRWESRLRRMGLPSDLARYAPRWSAALEVAEAVDAACRAMEERILWNSNPRIIAQIESSPTAPLGDIAIFRHPTDR